jgi:ferric-dicitrate binding protein FerR (iron transport regulator)
LRSIARAALAARPSGRDVSDDDLRALVQASEGLPGRTVSLVTRLADSGAWRDGRVRVGALKSQVVIDELERYRAGLEWGGAA